MYHPFSANACPIQAHRVSGAYGHEVGTNPGWAANPAPLFSTRGGDSGVPRRNLTMT